MSDEGLTTLTPERVRELLWEHQGRATGQKFAPYSTLLVGEFFALCDAWLAAQGRDDNKVMKCIAQGGNHFALVAFVEHLDSWFRRNPGINDEGLASTTENWRIALGGAAPPAPIPREGER